MDEEQKKRLEKKIEELEKKLARITVDDKTPIPMPMIPTTFAKEYAEPLYPPTGSTSVDDVKRYVDPFEGVTESKTVETAPEGMVYDPLTAKYIPEEPWRKPLTAEDMAKAKDEFIKMHGIDVTVGKSKPKLYRTPKTMILDSHEKVMQLVAKEGKRYDAQAMRHGFNYILRCARHFEMLTWCGYIAVGRSHPCYKLGVEQLKTKYGVDLEAHGGITYTGHGIPTGQQGEQTHKDHWVFGFDTLHAFDYAPGVHETLRKIKKESALKGIDKFSGYKDLPFVQAEVVSMLQQIDKMIGVDKLTDKKKSSGESIDPTYRMSVEPKVIEGTARLSTVRADDIEEAPFDLTRTVTGTRRFQT